MGKSIKSGFFRNGYILKESLLATLFTLAITLLISFIPLKFEYSKGIHQEFLGFDIYDLYYSGKNLENTKRDTNIILVQIAKDRKEIASQIEIIKKYSPAVIGIDAVFETAGETIDNIPLINSLANTRHIVLASRVNIDTLRDKVELVRSFFDDETTGMNSGYINFLGNRFSVIRNYPPFYKVNDSLYPAFSTSILKVFSPAKFEKLKKRKNNIEIINYAGNLEYYTCLLIDQLQHADKNNQLQNLFRGKIILLGYFVKESPGTPLVIEDLHFSPLNLQVSGKSYPDMYGVMIHANILSMALNDNYAESASEFFSYLLAGIFIFVFLYYMLYEYKKMAHPRHGKILIIQFVFILILLYGFLKIFGWFHLKFPLLPIMISLVLCVELLGVYKNIALWMHRKYKFKTVFALKHII